MRPVCWVAALRKQQALQGTTGPAAPPRVRPPAQTLHNKTMEDEICGLQLAEASGRRTYTYKLGEWFTPCQWNIHDCHRERPPRPGRPRVCCGSRMLLFA